MNQTWLPFDPDTCPQNVPIIIYGENYWKEKVMALVTYEKSTYPGFRIGEIRTEYSFHTQGVGGCEVEDDFDSSYLPTHYMPAPQPPKE